MEQLTERDFRELPLAEIERRTGLAAPRDPTPDEAETYRAKAWDSYRIDIRNRDEWGTATQSTPVPDAEDSDL